VNFKINAKTMTFGQEPNIGMSALFDFFMFSKPQIPLKGSDFESLEGIQSNANTVPTDVSETDLHQCLQVACRGIEMRVKVKRRVPKVTALTAVNGGVCEHLLQNQIICQTSYIQTQRSGIIICRYYYPFEARPNII
jgi:hypothetical protein